MRPAFLLKVRHGQWPCAMEDHPTACKLPIALYHLEMSVWVGLITHNRLEAVVQCNFRTAVRSKKALTFVDNDGGDVAPLHK